MSLVSGRAKRRTCCTRFKNLFMCAEPMCTILDKPVWCTHSYSTPTPTQMLWTPQPKWKCALVRTTWQETLKDSHRRSPANLPTSSRMRHLREGTLPLTRSTAYTTTNTHTNHFHSFGLRLHLVHPKAWLDNRKDFIIFLSSDFNICMDSRCMCISHNVNCEPC